MSELNSAYEHAPALAEARRPWSRENTRRVDRLAQVLAEHEDLAWSDEGTAHCGGCDAVIGKQSDSTDEQHAALRHHVAEQLAVAVSTPVNQALPAIERGKVQPRTLGELRRHWGLSVDIHRRPQRLAEFDLALMNAILPSFPDVDGLEAASNAVDTELSGDGYANADTAVLEAVHAYLSVVAQKMGENLGRS